MKNILAAKQHVEKTDEIKETVDILIGNASL